MILQCGEVGRRVRYGGVHFYASRSMADWTDLNLLNYTDIQRPGKILNMETTLPALGILFILVTLILYRKHVLCIVAP